jgi:lysozyme family protein
MAKFEPALEYVLKNEGGYVNDPLDPGGATNMGITLKTAKAHADKFGDPNIRTVEQLKAMTKAQAAKIYKMGWWQFENINSQELATRLFDTSINMDAAIWMGGANPSVRLLQWVLRLRGENIAVDGKFGPKTLAATNAFRADDLIPMYAAAKMGSYDRIVVKTPTSKKFLEGWYNRTVKKVPA